MKTGTRVLTGWGMAFVLVCGLTLAHVFILGRGPSFVSPLMLADRLFELGATLLLVLTCIGLGHFVLRVFGVSLPGAVGRVVLDWGVGAGVLGYLVFGLGLLGWLSGPVLWFIFGFLFLVTWREWGQAGGALQTAWRARKPFSTGEKFLLTSLVALVLPILLGALTPPIEGDALSYQLAAPAVFLREGRILPLFENAGANYPLHTGMLFMFGLAVGSPIVAQLTHFAFGVMLMGAIYGLASENFGRFPALLTCVIFWTSPVIGLEANSPLVDLGWVFYEVAAIWMFWRWHQKRSLRWLALCGLFLGLAISNKYLAFVGWGVMVLLVTLDVFVRSPRQWFPALVYGGIVALVGLLTAAPWLLKNLFMLGNPVYPFFLGTYGLDGQVHKPTGSAGGLGDWVAAGMGHDLKALLLFPFNVYVHWQNFDPVKNRGGPGLLFWFAPLYLLVRKHPLINLLVVLIVVRFAVWWNLTQFVRYGLILFPLASLVTGYVLWELLLRVRGRWLAPVLRTVTALGIAAAIFLQWGFLLLLREGAVSFVAGMQSASQYLNTNLHDYSVTRFMNTRLPSSAKIFALGDTRAFYLERNFIPDTGHTNWSDLANLAGNAAQARRQLDALGVTHIWVSQDEIVYARNFWQIPAPWEDTRLSFGEFAGHYLALVYTDERGHRVYALVPDTAGQ